MKYKTNMTLRGAACGCAWNYNINRSIVNLLYCAVPVYVCVKCEWTGFLLSCDAKKMPLWEQITLIKWSPVDPLSGSLLDKCGLIRLSGTSLG